MEKVVEIKNLYKRFGKVEILHDISLDIYEDEIVGFIGPNGAGKSTTMKCMCNLIFPTEGTIKICGYDLLKEREKALGVQSSMIETPGLFPNLTGKENLTYFATYKKASKEKINEIIEFMNLGNDINKQTSKYSLGMKQRLGLGIALLSDPKLLILDEPTNGLDPTGVFELRMLLKKLAKEKHVSIFISSHQLGELEKITDRYVFINNGRLIKNTGKIQGSNCYHITMIKSNSVEAVLYNHPKVTSLLPKPDGYDIFINEETRIQEILTILSEQNIVFEDITKKTVDIESVYSEVYGDKND